MTTICECFLLQSYCRDKNGIELLMPDIKELAKVYRLLCTLTFFVFETVTEKSTDTYSWGFYLTKTEYYQPNR